MGMEGRRFVTSFFYIFFFAGEVFFLFLAVKSGTDFFVLFWASICGSKCWKVSEKLMSGGVAR